MQKAQQKQRRKAFAQQKQTHSVFAKRTASVQLKEPAVPLIPTYKFSTATGSRRVKMSCWDSIHMRKIIMTDDFALLILNSGLLARPSELHVLVQNDVSYNSGEVKLLVEYAESMLGKKFKFSTSSSYMVHNYKRGYTFKELMY